jgi:Putative prokaryotic signal transducing protein
MKRVYVAQNQVDAQLVAEELRAGGVAAIVKVDTVAAPSIPFPSVWVEERDLTRAVELLGERSAPADDAV